MAGDIHVNLGRFSNGVKSFRDDVYNPVTKSARAIKSFNGGKNSITALSKDLIMQFPVLMSAGVSSDQAMTIAQALQRQYASLHLAIWSADTAFGIDSSQNGIRDFVRRYHNNEDIPDLITYGGNLLTNVANISGAFAHESVGVEESTQEFTFTLESAEFITDAEFVDPNEILSLWDIPELKFATESINDLYNPNLRAIDTINDIAEALEAAKTPKAPKHKITPQERYERYAGITKHDKKLSKLNKRHDKLEEKQEAKDAKEIKRQMDKYGRVVNTSKISKLGGSTIGSLKAVNANIDKYAEMDSHKTTLNRATGEFDETYKYGYYGYKDGSSDLKDYGLHSKVGATPRERERAYKKAQHAEKVRKDKNINNEVIDNLSKASAGFSDIRRDGRSKDDVAKFIRDDKLSSLEPILMDVSFLVKGGHNDAMMGSNPTKNGHFKYTSHAVVGVKCMVRLISPELMIPNVISSCQDSSLAFKFVKWTKGEMKVMRDMVFNISQIKDDARAKNTADKWFAALRKRKRNAKSFKFGGSTGINPFCTLVITAEDALQIRETSGYDLYNLETARKLMDNLYLLGFMIVNTSTEIVSTLYDGYADFEDTTLKSLKIGNASKDPTDQMLEIMKRMNRI